MSDPLPNILTVGVVQTIRDWAMAVWDLRDSIPTEQLSVTCTSHRGTLREDIAQLYAHMQRYASRLENEAAGQASPYEFKGRLALLSDIPPLKSGQHESRESGMCVMEAAAYIAGEPHSDQPACVCPAIADFLRSWNDALLSDAERDRLLRDLIPVVIGTRATPAVEMRRRWLACDWLIRTHTVAWLRAAKLDAHADALATLPEIQDEASLPASAAVDALAAAAAAAAAAAKDADDAWADAWAAWDSVGHAAIDTTRYCASDAAGAAAAAAAKDAARAAAEDAVMVCASYAAGAVIDPTITMLQESARDLVRRMAAVREVRP